MPGGRRLLPRSQAASNLVHRSPKSESNTSNGNTPTDDMASQQQVILKHVHIPDIPSDSNLLFELILFVYCVVAMCMQYINLYKTVWWLPHSHATYAVNFYLIDPHLVLFLVLLFSRRLIWCWVKEVYGGKSSKSCCYWFVQLLKLLVTGCALSLFGWAAYHVVLTHTLLHSLFLCYPLVIYFILFGPNVKPLFDRSLVWPASVSDKSSPKHRSRDRDNSEIVLRHTCSSSPEAIREEVESFKQDFNNRVKQVLFNSMLCAYYVGFVPISFAQNTLYYDAWWVGQHVVLVWISAFIMFMVHFLSPKYTDMLHKCALHLGRWQKVEGRHAHVPYNPWSELQVWHQGALVKHVKGLFRAEGFNNTAEPGNSMHTRFYFLFYHPLRVGGWLLLLTTLLIGYQFFTLTQCTEWSHTLTLAVILFANYYILFKLLRDQFILRQCYRDEKTLLQQPKE
ncbi:transmembrane protein 39A [Lingula anatina]|uniref:Transmembrane protein 39A n=1 Tax=Lingula anatina TaxID=7574 RepID=A0A1S3JZD6_LINAN|nr:transmembrane protein 39A [Lingula anatina]|eukprot:XP_013415459.1 transmembrane protein 39A [Lingula anatina]